MALATIQTAYSYYLSTYGNNSATRYDTHKKSELRNVYNNIIKVNKESPLYKIKNDQDVQTFAIDIKESARNIQNVVSSLSSSNDIMKAFQKKSAVSSQKDIVKANYIGSTDDTESAKDFEIEVTQLAKPQINIGNYLKNSTLNLKPDNYSFDLETNVNAYEFQFSVNPDDTNLSIQKKLARLITNADIGLTATVIEDTYEHSALKIVSSATGLLEEEDYLFKISAAGSQNSAKAIETLGIDHMAQVAQNSKFLLDGRERTSYSNTFTINNTFELTLLGISQEDNPATVGFIADIDAISDNIHVLVNSYNSILQTASKYSETQQQSTKLANNMSRTAFEYKNELEAIGLNINENGSISIDPIILENTIRSENPSEHFDVLNDFKKELNEKASYAVLNPMEYVNKIMVAYKNPGKNFATPYITSIYSGMMMDRYC